MYDHASLSLRDTILGEHADRLETDTPNLATFDDTVQTGASTKLRSSSGGWDFDASRV